MTPFNRTWIPRVSALAALCMVAACNIFNPSGTGDRTAVTADDFIQRGQEDLRALRFGDAFEAFSTALALDSSKSLAWHGLAKAQIGKDGFSIGEVVDIAENLSNAADDEKLTVLLDLGDTGITKLYRPLMRVASIYNRFRIYDSAKGTDHVFGSNLILTELNTIYSNRSYFLLIDANRDTVVQNGELAGLKLMNIASGGLEISAEKLIEQGQIDTATGALPPETIENINGILNNVTAITSDTNILNSLIDGAIGKAGEVSGTGTENSEATAELNAQAKTFIQKLGSSTAFFLINDSLDNDFDGCVNEEMFGDSLDNDGDALKDEDGRVGLRKVYTATPGALAMLTPPDNFRHDSMRIGASKMEVVGTTTEPLLIATGTPISDELQVLTYEDGTGLVQLFKDMRWVTRTDSSVDVRNDTIWTRILAEEGTTVTGFESLSVARQSEIKMLATIEIRRKVQAETDPRKRAILGKKIVGGCWDNVKL
ncbi:MAG: hypothetical protein RL173_1446 [Fibrobacterota bacterium]